MARLLQITTATRLSDTASSIRSRSLMRYSCVLLMGLTTCVGVTHSLAATPEEPEPAKLKISGYGFLGNRQLKRIVKTLELGRKRTDSFGAAFVEDAALI